jgi:hypothetical protein
MQDEGYWCSTGGHSNDQIVIWQGDIDSLKRVETFWIHWAYSPGQFSIQTTSDGSTWEERIGWKNGGKGGNTWQFLKSVFGFGNSADKSYVEKVSFEEPIWIKGLRIMMRNPVWYYFGIYRVKVWTKQWNIMLKNGFGGNQYIRKVSINNKKK